MRRFAVATVVLVVCITASLYGLVQAGTQRAHTWMTVFAFASALLTLALVFGIAIPFAYKYDGEAQEGNKVETPLDHRDGKYIAKQSTSDRIQIVIVALISTVIAALILARPTSLWMKCVFPGMAVALALIAIHYCFATVDFMSEGILVKPFPFLKSFHSYNDVAECLSSPGRLHVRFEDGKTLDIRPGLDDAGKLISILNKRIENGKMRS